MTLSHGFRRGRLVRLERHGDIHKPDPVGCFFRRRRFEEALWVLCELGPEEMETIVRNHLERHMRSSRREVSCRIAFPNAARPGKRPR